MSWESPISMAYSFDDISKKLAEEVDEKVYKAVCDVVVNVDKEELLKALRYDRNQYDKGYWDGRMYKPPVVTNADRIRAMTDEELSTWLGDMLGVYPFGPNQWDSQRWLEYLKQEAVE